MNRFIVALYRIATVVAVMFPVLNDGKLGANHNETLVLDRG